MNEIPLKSNPIRSNSIHRTTVFEGPTKMLLPCNPSTRHLPAIFLWNFPGKNPPFRSATSPINQPHLKETSQLYDLSIYLYIYSPRPAIETSRN